MREPARSTDRLPLGMVLSWLLYFASLVPLCSPAIANDAVDRDVAVVLAMKGDAAYGEYLSSECVTCHKLKGHAGGIPQIVGLSADFFIRALVEYKHKTRDHQIMNMVTGTLGTEELAALAAYFASIQLP